MEFVTDRTESDVLLRTEKGMYGSKDLNRVEKAVKELAVMASALDIHVSSAVKTNWNLQGAFSAGEWPVAANLARYLRNVWDLCNACSVNMPLPTSMNFLTWEDANNIERALQSVYSRICGVVQTYQFSGELFAGEG